MVRPRRTSSVPVSSGQATYILDRLIQERRVSPIEVNRYVAEMRDEIANLERRLQVLREASGGMRTRGQTGVRPKPTRRRRSGRWDRRPDSSRPFGPVPGDPPTEPNLGDPPKPPPSGPPTKPGRVKRSTRVTPEVAASRKLQGRYLALVRQMSKGKRKRYSKTAKEKGREAAIKEMMAALKK